MSLERGHAMSTSKAWELGNRWYADRLRLDWKLKTPEVMESILAEVGLTGSFWDVRA